MVFPGHTKSLYLQRSWSTVGRVPESDRAVPTDNDASKDSVSSSTDHKDSDTLVTSRAKSLTRPSNINTPHAKLNSFIDSDRTSMEDREVRSRLINNKFDDSWPRVHSADVDPLGEVSSPPAARRYDSYRPESHRTSIRIPRDEPDERYTDLSTTLKHGRDTHATPGESGHQDRSHAISRWSGTESYSNDRQNGHVQSSSSFLSEPHSDSVMRARQQDTTDELQPTFQAVLGFKGLESVFELLPTPNANDQRKLRTKSSGNRLRSGNDETGSVITDLTTSSSRSLLSRKKLCSGCKEAESIFSRLVPCLTCPRRYHSACGSPSPSMNTIDAFVCGSCLKKSRALDMPIAQSAPSVSRVSDAVARHVDTGHLYANSDTQDMSIRLSSTTKGAPSPPHLVRGRKSVGAARDAEITRRRYKEEVTCNFWLMSSCQRRDEDCMFAHHRTSITAPTGKHHAPAWTCYRWRSTGSCTRTPCLYAHIDTGLHTGPDDKASKKHVYCFWMAKTGSCSRRDNCLFSHLDTGILAQEPPDQYGHRNWRTASGPRLSQQDRHTNEDSPVHSKSPELQKGLRDNSFLSSGGTFGVNDIQPAANRLSQRHNSSSHSPTMPRHKQEIQSDDTILSRPTNMSVQLHGPQKLEQGESGSSATANVSREADMVPSVSSAAEPAQDRLLDDLKSRVRALCDKFAGTNAAATSTPQVTQEAPYPKCLECSKIIFSNSDTCLGCTKKTDPPSTQDLVRSPGPRLLTKPQNKDGQVSEGAVEKASTDNNINKETVPTVVTRKRTASGTRVFAPEKRIKIGGGMPLITNYPISEALKQRSSVHKNQPDMLDQSQDRVEMTSFQQEARTSTTEPQRSTRSTGVQTSPILRSSTTADALMPISPHLSSTTNRVTGTSAGAVELTKESSSKVDVKATGGIWSKLKISTVIPRSDEIGHSDSQTRSVDRTKRPPKLWSESRRTPRSALEEVVGMSGASILTARTFIASKREEQDLQTSIARLVGRGVRFESADPSDNESEARRDTVASERRLGFDDLAQHNKCRLSKGQGLKGQKGIFGNSLILRRQMKQNTQLCGNKHATKTISTRPWPLVKARVVREEAITLDDPKSSADATMTPQVPMMREVTDESDMTILEFLGIAKETRYEHKVVKQVFRIKGHRGQPAQLLEKMSLVMKETVPMDQTVGNRTRRNTVKPRVWVVGGSETVVTRSKDE